MDPNANLRAQEQILAKPAANEPDSLSHGTLSSYDRYALYDLRIALRDWLRNGGFAPNWDACPTATRAYETWSGKKVH